MSAMSGNRSRIAGRRSKCVPSGAMSQVVPRTAVQVKGRGAESDGCTAEVQSQDICCWAIADSHAARRRPQMELEKALGLGRNRARRRFAPVRANRHQLQQFGGIDMCYQPDFSAHERAIHRALLDLYATWAAYAREYIDAAGLDRDASVEEFYIDMLKQMQWLGKQERRHVRAQKADAVSAEEPHAEPPMSEGGAQKQQA